MSKKKDRKIKRMQRLAIWPAIVEMLITELIIFVLTIFICALAIFGIINTLVLNNSKECHTVVEFVNDNWEKMTREQMVRVEDAIRESLGMEIPECVEAP